jgi:hypothetical protein
MSWSSSYWLSAEQAETERFENAKRAKESSFLIVVHLLSHSSVNGAVTNYWLSDEHASTERFEYAKRA